LVDQDWIGLMISNNFADQDWTGFNFTGSELASDWEISQSAHLCSPDRWQVFEVSANFQFLQKTQFKSSWSGADYLLANIESYFNHVLR